MERRVVEPIVTDANLDVGMPGAAVIVAVESAKARFNLPDVVVAYREGDEIRSFVVAQAQPRVRILGPVTREAADLLRKADAIFIEELRKHDLYDQVSQAFAVFLPVRSVAVMGDGRKYDWVIALRAVETVDFMTAHWSRLPYDFLGHVSLRIVNEVAGVSRVVYDVSGKPPATIEWE